MDAVVEQLPEIKEEEDTGDLPRFAVVGRPQCREVQSVSMP